MNDHVKSLTGEAPEALHRCNVCEVSRPEWAFHRYSKNHTAAGKLRAVCRACEGGGDKNPTSLREQKKLGVPLDQIQSDANMRIDRIRARDKREPFNMAAHRRRKGIEALAAPVTDRGALPQDRPPQPERTIAKCRCCERDEPHAHAWIRQKWVLRPYCKHCDGSSTRRTSNVAMKKSGVPLSVIWEKIDAAKRRASQTHIEDIAPGQMSPTAAPSGLTMLPGVPDKPKPLPKPRKAATAIIALDRPSNVVDIEEMLAKKQADFERREEAPKESRQVRRARERRITKDAQSAVKARLMSQVEIVTHVLDAATAARSRAKGGDKVITKRVAKVKWDLPPLLVGEMLKRSGYRCALTGEPFRVSTGYGSTNPFKPSPNRIDPGGDYTEANCELVCWWVNRLINDMPRPAAISFLRERGLLRKDFGQPAML